MGYEFGLVLSLALLKFLIFMFQLTKEDCIRCQIGTLYERGGKTLNWSTYRPLAFAENGIAMLSGVLRSPTAIEVNIRIMRAFAVLRHFVSDHAGLVQRVGAIELKQLETDKRIDTVFDALDRGNLLPNGILPAGSEYDSLRYVSRLVESAKSEIVIIDPYSDATTLDVLAKKQPGVTVRLVCKDRGKATSWESAVFSLVHDIGSEVARHRACIVELSLSLRGIQPIVGRGLSGGGTERPREVRDRTVAGPCGDVLDRKGG